MMDFNRTASLVIGTEVLNLRVIFDIEKEMTANGASKCEIKIYNLSPEHLAQIEVGTQKQQLTLSAGYNGANKMLYSGPIFYAHTDQVGPDKITTCQMLPGAIALSAVFVKISGASSAWEVYQAVLNAFLTFGVSKGHLSTTVSPGAAPGTKPVRTILQGLKYRAKYSNMDTAAGFMNEITRWAKLRWNIENNQLNVFADGEYQDAEIIQLDESSGMLGIPSKTQEGNYKVKALLDGDLNPGRRIRVVSKTFPVNGDLRIIKTTYAGDTHPLDPGADWYAEVEGSNIGTAPGFSIGQAA
jgi:hypothetical protein